MNFPRVALLAIGCALTGCNTLNVMPASGPLAQQVRESSGYELVPLSRSAVLALARADRGISPADLPEAQTFSEAVRAGDILEVGLWEASPALLLGGTDGTSSSAGRGAAIPAQPVSLDGSISVPYVGRLRVAGLKPAEIEARIIQALEGRANRPHALVRVGSAIGQEVSVVGGVRNNMRFGLTARNERLLDAIALSGGSTFPIEKTVVQLTRGPIHASVPLDTVVRDPRQNVMLGPADIVTVYHQPKSFVAMGAVAKVGDVPFEATGLDLAQALARAGGALDTRADAGGVFIARRSEDRLTIYQLDLREPGSLFVMREFRVEDRDVIYVANASGAELQKFLALLGAAVYPLDAAARNLGGN